MPKQMKNKMTLRDSAKSISFKTIKPITITTPLTITHDHCPLPIPDEVVKGMLLFVRMPLV